MVVKAVVLEKSPLPERRVRLLWGGRVCRLDHLWVQLQRRRAVGLSMVWGRGSAGCAGARPQGQPAVRGGQGGIRSGEEGVVQARQPENIERRWVLAAALERV